MITYLKDEGLYYIGGIVRDMILGRESFDVDITYVGNAIEYAKTIDNAEILRISPDFGTVKIRLYNTEIDLASTRNEEYPKAGHLPVVTEIGCSLKKDVERRDFTINTLAKSVKTGEIVDYLGGLKDIENKTIRVLHDNSFVDDPTRILRALKFSVRFNFSLDKKTRELQEKYLNNINYDMSYKRLKKELIETFNLNKQECFERFFSEKIYKLLLDKDVVMPNYDIETLIKKYPVNDVYMVYLGWLDLQNLPLTKKESKIISDYNDLKHSDLNDDYSIYLSCSNKEKESLLLYAITVNDQKIFRYLDELSKIKLSVGGEDIKRMGIAPSKKYSECLNYVLKEKIKNKNINEQEAIKKFFN